jgi:hypothetical protein
LTMLSRGRSNPDGKLTERLDVPVTEDLHEAVIALATIQGMTKAEWVRAVLEDLVYGRLSMLRKVSGHGHVDQLDVDRSTFG